MEGGGNKNKNQVSVHAMTPNIYPEIFSYALFVKE